jgi:hypothetical protein
MAYAPITGTKQAQNALLPRDLFGTQVKPGDTITLKVSAVFGDEVEVSATAESGEEPEMEMEEEAMPRRPTADEEIEAAAQNLNYGNANATMG